MILQKIFDMHWIGYDGNIPWRVSELFGQSYLNGQVFEINLTASVQCLPFASVSVCLHMQIFQYETCHFSCLSIYVHEIYVVLLVIGFTYSEKELI